MKWNPVKVPAHWEMEGFAAESGRAVYRKTFQVPAEWQGKRIKLLAEAIYSHAQVWVNGKTVGGHEGGFTPVRIGHHRRGQDRRARIRILVLVDARTHGQRYRQRQLLRLFRAGGNLAADRSLCHLAGLSFAFDGDHRFRSGLCRRKTRRRVRCRQSAGRQRRFPSAGGCSILKAKKCRLPIRQARSRSALGSEKLRSSRQPVRSPQTWNAEQPRLYTFLAEITDSHGTKNTVEQRFGFRKIAVKGRVLTLNGKPVKFRGISRLDAHPLLGRAVTPEVDRLDMEMIKDANFNLVRATIAPPHPASLDASDELGLYVENEGPACWGNHARDLRYAALYRG